MKDFSIIVPVYYLEEELQALEGIAHILKTLQEFNSPYIQTWELIIVVDGPNQKLAEKIRKALVIKKNKEASCKVIEYEENQGKGYALVSGFTQSNGRFITFIDCDGDINLKQILNFFPYLATADIVIGSKRHPFSKINYPLSRRIMSRGFQMLSWLVLGSSLRDTQSGLKIFKREVLDIIVSSVKITSFSIDLEICFLAQKHGFRVVEAPIEIQFKGSSTIRIRTIFKMLWDILKIRFWFTFKRSYQNKFTDKYF